tara:strand:+ start:11 stop:547 length:537 start_codon:yes stop_codon:yes gene_type:complete
MVQKSSTLQTMETFFDYPNKEFSLKDISIMSKLAHTSTKKNLDLLLKKDIIKKKNIKKGIRTFPIYFANKNKEFITAKKINNHSKIYESDLIRYLEEEIMPKCIVLFGSFQKGEDIEQSDIDLFIESPKLKIDLKKFEKKMKRKIELHFKENFSKYPKELKNNIINGTVLFGFLEGFK